eukprot:TRINITY_DN18802_c0_g1_i2.p1 TRINITY_DN18802_c0_g1~~TRINITY_DN18802_c0_g1_i2.p1  ORF type:complete len:883 (-),score=108.12 TRINITY_DN18802_c0_g1_i2:288-2579(-)
MVMVTGGAGYIGSHMSLRLLESGFDIVIVDNLSRGNILAIRILQAEACRLRRSVAFANIDLGKPRLVERLMALSAPKAVLHFAGNAVAPESMKIPLLYYRNVTENTLILVNAMEQTNTHNLIYSSSCATYGNPDAAHNPVAEDAPQKPVSNYGESKLMAERMISAWAKLATGRCAVILRYFNVYGADPEARLGKMPEDAYLKSFSRASDALLDAALGRRPSFTMFGDTLPTKDGSAERDYVHVWDLVEAHMSVLTRMLSNDIVHKACVSSAFNLGTGKSTSVRSLVKAARTLPVSHSNFQVEIKPARPGDPVRVFADPSKMMSEFGWKARFTDASFALITSLRFQQKYAKLFGLPERSEIVPLPSIAPMSVATGDATTVVPTTTVPAPTTASTAIAVVPTTTMPVTAHVATSAAVAVIPATTASKAKTSPKPPAIVPSKPIAATTTLWKPAHRDNLSFQPIGPNLYSPDQIRVNEIPNATLDTTPFVVHRFASANAAPRMCMQCAMIPGILKGAPYQPEVFYIQREYARRHGYDLYILTSKLDARRHPSWHKIMSSRAIMNSSGACDYIFWLDSDVVIMNMSFKLEWLIGYHGNNDTDLVASGDTVAVNAAQTLWKATPWNFQFLLDMWNMGDIQLWETGAINALIGGCQPRDGLARKQACYNVADRGWKDHPFSLRIKAADPSAMEAIMKNKSLAPHISWIPKRVMNSYPFGLFWGQFQPGDPDFLVHLVDGGKREMDKWLKIAFKKNNLTLPKELVMPKRR